METTDGVVAARQFNITTEWRKFRDALTQELRATRFDEFESAWQKGPDGDQFCHKNQFYKKLIRNVAACLGYDSTHDEYLRIDYVYLNKERVPVVFIECENNHATAGLPFHEIDNLCAVNSPVKALFLSCDWSDGERDKYLSSWTNRIATHHKYSGQNAVYVIVVGEWGRRKSPDEILRYYIESFDTSGKEFEPAEVLELNKQI